jgi:hypothetical protein
VQSAPNRFGARFRRSRPRLESAGSQLAVRSGDFSLRQLAKTHDPTGGENQRPTGLPFADLGLADPDLGMERCHCIRGGGTE